MNKIYDLIDIIGNRQIDALDKVTISQLKEIVVESQRLVRIEELHKNAVHAYSLPDSDPMKEKILKCNLVEDYPSVIKTGHC